MEIWHTLTGQVDKRGVQDSIRSINEEIYSKPIRFLRFLLATAGGSGETDAAINLYSYLKALPIEVETIAFGEIDVAATIIFLGGKRRIAVEHSQFFFREGRYTITDPTAPVHAHEEAIAAFKKELHEMIYIIAKETGNDTEVVAGMLRRTKIMRADEAKEFGLCHEVTVTLPLHQQEKLGFQTFRPESTVEKRK